VPVLSSPRRPSGLPDEATIRASVTTHPMAVVVTCALFFAI
jgi:hypothetical protein